MKAGVLHELGRVSVADFPDPRVTQPGQEVVSVIAAGLNHLDIAKASGQFYSAPPPIPSIAGSDGVGITADGRRVYFERCIAPYGSLAEKTLVQSDTLLPVLDAVPDDVAAALGNAGTAAAIALVWRGRMNSGDRVLIVGATGAVGQLATQLARTRGAKLVVAAGRDAQRLRRLTQDGARAVELTGTRAVQQDLLQTASPEGYDVIIDLICGDPGNAALRCAAPGARYVQVGAKAGTELEIPATLLRSRLLTVTGTAGFLEPHHDRAAAYAMMQDVFAAGDLRVSTESFDLNDVERAWRRQVDGAGTKLIMRVARTA